MPVIEALAAGTPVVASDAASLPEALGGQGRLVPALDVPAWTEELRRAAAGGDTEPLRTARRQHATAWTWGDAAQRTFEMYRAAI
jgi:glycosyltransferase involved in cell wall biosynthesis